jgi:UDP-N-acetylmuramate--alanine ligase
VAEGSQEYFSHIFSPGPVITPIVLPEYSIERDEVILLPVYPARESPIPGVSSELILNKMKLTDKRLLQMEDLPAALDPQKLDVLVTIGAGDIDKLVGPIERRLKGEQ